MEQEYFLRSSAEYTQTNKIGFSIIENPERMLSDGEKEDIIQAGMDILGSTTGIKKDKKDVRRFMFGIRDKGRVLCLLRGSDRIIGFISFHLVNKDHKFVRFKNRTILHAGSGHVRPDYQGRAFWPKAVFLYLARLPEVIKPKYVEGFTQSPRFLKLITIMAEGKIYPNLSGVNIGGLKDLQEEILPAVLPDWSRMIQFRNGCVISGMGEQVYSERVHANDEYDDFFYKRLEVKPEQGDFLHFVVEIPDRLYQ